jgi:hypothetical protein
MKYVDYKEFIEENFLIKNKHGEIVPFIFNDTQNYYYKLLEEEHQDFQGIRENILKFRQPGFSSLIDAIFTVDFILAERGEAPITDSDIYSHKVDETKVLFDRVSDYFYNSWISNAYSLDFFEDNNDIKSVRSELLELDSGTKIKGKNGALINVQTASAKVSGRGGTKQNLHLSEIAFYPNTEIMSAENLVTAAEQQVVDDFGKIFRETTGNIAGDYFDIEFQKGSEGIGEFKSRFLGWWLHEDYKREVPKDWIMPKYYEDIITRYNIELEQIYWHFKKTDNLKDKKKLREYPTYSHEAFLYGGDCYFDKDALQKYTSDIAKPILETTDLVRFYETI